MAEFKINADKKSASQGLQHKVMDINGSILHNSNDKFGVAKEIYDPDSNNKTFFIKTSTTGRDKGRLFDPKGMYAVALDARNLETGRMHYEYRKVSEKCFARYTEFINNGGSLSLRHAQREADY
jgi:hypothetical protein